MKHFFLCCVVSLALLSCGCGPTRTSVSGTVTLHGEPLKDVVVLMQPYSENPLTTEAAFGKTDSRGRFSLASVGTRKNGVVPGEYSVFINWNDPNPPPENEPPNPSPYDIPPNARDGSHRCRIEPNGSQTIDFELSALIVGNDSP